MILKFTICTIISVAGMFVFGRELVKNPKNRRAGVMMSVSVFAYVISLLLTFNSLKHNHQENCKHNKVKVFGTKRLK